MSALIIKYRPNFVRLADEVLRTAGVPKKIFSYTLNSRIIAPLRGQGVDEGVICELRDEAFRIFDVRRAVSNNRRTGRNSVQDGWKDVIRYDESNEVPRVNGVRR